MTQNILTNFSAHQGILTQMKKIVILVILLLPTTSGCSTVGLSALNATAKLESGHDVVRDIEYGDEDWQKLNVHQPKTRFSQNIVEAQKPVIIFFYGGGWTSGDKDQYYFAASAFTDIGYIVVLPNYVLYPEGKFPDFVKDGAKAIAWANSNIASYGGNADQLFVVGHSAGAHIGALLVADKEYLAQEGLDTNVIKAFAGMAGPYNFTPKEKPYTLIFGPEENFTKMKVMNFIDGDEPPMLLLHGTDDKTVGILNKDSLIESIKEQGGEYGDISYQGESHVGILLNLHHIFDGDADTAKDIDQFFEPYKQPNTLLQQSNYTVK